MLKNAIHKVELAHLHLEKRWFIHMYKGVADLHLCNKYFILRSQALSPLETSTVLQTLGHYGCKMERLSLYNQSAAIFKMIISEVGYFSPCEVL